MNEKEKNTSNEDKDILSIYKSEYTIYKNTYPH